MGGVASLNNTLFICLAWHKRIVFVSEIGKGNEIGNGDGVGNGNGKGKRLVSHFPLAASVAQRANCQPRTMGTILYQCTVVSIDNSLKIKYIRIWFRKTLQLFEK